jgi:hypothetical protein
MATIAATIDRNTVAGVVLVTWDAMATGDVGGGVPIAFAADLSLQQSGTIGGSTTTWQGSNDNTTWHPLTQRGSTTDMAYTTASLHSAQENPAFIRPAVTGGTSVVIKCVACVVARYGKTPY